MNNENEKILPENLELNLSDFALFLSVMKHKAAYECAVSIILDERDAVSYTHLTLPTTSRV